MSPLRGKKDEKAMDLQHEEAMAERSRPEGPMTDEYVNSLGRSVYSIIDPEVLAAIQKNKLDSFLPLLSHLNRMTQLTKQDVDLAKLDLEANFLMFEALRDEGKYNTKQALLVENLQFFANFMLTDSFEGFKAKILAYQMKIIRTELEEKKTKGWFG